MKKRIALTLALSILAAALATAAIPEVSGSGNDGDADVVVLLDSSQSVLPYFQDVTDYVLSSVVKDFLRFGDTFHLLTFGDSAQAEIAQKMSDERDVKSVLGRLYLLYPLSRHSDFLGALSYLRQYLTDLPVSRKKIVVVITDGVQNSPPESRSATMDKAQISAEIEKECQAIRANGWDLRLIKLPFAPKVAATGAAAGSAAAAAEGAGESYIDVAATALGARVSEFDPGTKESLARTSLSLPTVEYPANLGKRGYDFAFPLKISNGSDSEVDFELESIALGPDDILAKKSFLKLSPGKSGVMDLKVALPDSLQPGPQVLTVEPRFANGVRVSPPNGTIAFTLAPLPFGSFFRSSLRVVLFAILLAIGLAAVLIAVSALRRVSKRAEAPIVDAVLDAASQDQRSAATTAATASGSSAARPAAAQKPAAAAAGAIEPRGIAVQPPAEAARSPAKAGAAALTGTTADQPSPAPQLPIRLAKPAADEHDLAIAKETEELAKAAKSDSSRAASVLAEAAQAGSAARDKVAAFKERMERERALAAAKKKQAAAAKPASTAAATAAPQAAAANGRGTAAAVVRPGTIRVEMKVEDQNPNIGMRNVCTIHAGQSKTVGGGRSDFLVFLVPAARNAADLHFDGERLTLVPRKPELFPGSEGPIEDCLGQEILMLGKSGYPLILRFVAYERPADKINRLLHCIETPGLVHDLDN